MAVRLRVSSPESVVVGSWRSDSHLNSCAILLRGTMWYSRYYILVLMKLKLVYNCPEVLHASISMSISSSIMYPPRFTYEL